MSQEKELKIIDEIARESGLTQRELSRRTSLSLGAVNIIIKRLISRGSVKTKALTPKKMEYILTPKGFSEKAKKSYEYVVKTINLVKLVRDEIAKIVLDEFNKGQKKFVVLGNDELSDIIELALKGFDYERVSSLKDIKNSGALILVGGGTYKTNGQRAINVADRLKNIYWGTE